MLKDPRTLPVKVNLTLPFWYHQQLKAQAAARGTSFNSLVLTALEEKYAPVAPAGAPR
jgi:predicted HicB family RNase H-like nuclease